MLDKSTKIGNGIEVKVFGKKELIGPKYGDVYPMLCGSSNKTLACYKAVYVGIRKNKHIFVARIDSDVIVFSSRTWECYGRWFNEEDPTIPMMGIVSTYAGRMIEGREKEFTCSVIKRHLESCINE